MMRSRPASLYPLFLLLFFFSCRGSGEGVFSAEDVALDVPAGAVAYVPHLEGPLRILSATPNGPMLGMAPGQSVAVTFSQPMVPLGEPIAVPEGALALRPEVPGKLQWDGTQTLVFQPSAPLPFNTAFEARLASGLQALGGDVLGEGFTWTFETPRPLLVSSDPADGERFVEPTRVVALAFNQAVNARQAARYVRLREAAGRRRLVETTVRADGDSALVVAHAAPLAAGQAYELLLLPGLPGAEGHLGLRDTTRVVFNTFGPLRLGEVTQSRPWWEDAGSGFNPERAVSVSFSTPVRFGDLRAALSFTPAVAWPAGIEAQDDEVSDVHLLPAMWAPETAYTLTVRNLSDQFGQRLAEAKAGFRTRALAPTVRMPEGVLVVEAGPQAHLPVQAVNAPARRLGLRRLAADQVIALLRAQDPGHYYGDGEGDDEPQPIAYTGRLTFDLPRNRRAVVPVGIDSLLRGGTGLVAFRLEGTAGPYGQQAGEHRGVAQVTRLGLTAKFSAHQNLFLVTELASARPVAGARLTVRDSANRVRWQGTTDAQGRAAGPGWSGLGMESPNAWNQPVQYAFAEHQGDVVFSSSVYNDGLEPYRFDMPFAWWPEPVTETGSVFSDRGLYRTGETVHLKAILRRKTDGDWSSLTGPVRVLVNGPRDEVVLDRPLQPSGLGTVDLSWTAPATADQGVYVVRVVHAADTSALTRGSWERGDVARGSFRVDAFRTSTFAVTARPAATQYVAGDFFEGAIEGRYLFGAAMGGQPVRYRLVRDVSDYAPPGYEGYRFGAAYGYEDYSAYQLLVEEDTVLDADGTVRTRLQVPGTEQGLPATLVWSGSVTDPARQELSASAEITLHPGLFYIGLKPRTTFLDLQRDDAMTVDVVTVDPGGVPVGDRSVDVELVRQQWNSVREVGADGRLRWRSERVEEAVARQRITTAPGRAKRLRLPLTQGGSYVVRATGRDRRGNAVRSEAYFYATGAGYVAWERTDDDRIDLIPERTTYRPGETARLLVQSPFEEATALVTVEREGILSSRVVTLTGSAPQIEVPLTEAHLPNVFVSVILLAGRGGGEGGEAPPAFKVGYASLRVDPGVRHLQVEVAPERDTYRPGDEVTVRLQLRDAQGRGVRGEIAFSAADAGVLNLIGYTLPDPFDAFYGPRDLGVTTTETRARLVDQRSFGQKEEDLIGGGGDRSLLMRRDFRPQAHWAPAVRTDARGQASVTFRVPESLTTFRLMAAALTADHRFGKGQADITVTQPLVLQPALPRFARLDDAVDAGVLVANRTDRAGEAVVTARGEGLALAGPDRQTVRLGPGETREVRFRWRAERVGPARLTFEAALGAERDAFEVMLPVAAPTAKRTFATFASTEGTAQEALRLPADHLPGMGLFTVQLASTALVGLDGAARYLFAYPYGCLEQQTSRVRPLLAGGDLLGAFDLKPLAGGRDAAVEAWLASLDGFWTADGFSLWPGGTYVNPYVNAYVVLALAEAKAAGFTVPAALTQRAVERLADQARNASAARPEYYDASVWSDTRALMLYALARHGRVLEGEVDALAAQHLATGILSAEGESLLLRTVVVAARPTLARHRAPLLERLRRRVRVEAETAYLAAGEGTGYGWIFASDTRATAFGLAALAETDATADVQQLGQRMVRYLMATRSGGHWASTQDNAAVVEAFRAYYQAFEKTAPDFRATVRAAGRELLQETFRGRSLAVARAEAPPSVLAGAAPATVEVAKEGTGRLYYALQLESYTRAPQPAEDRGLRVERRLQRLDDRGSPVGGVLAADAQLPAGALVRVTLRIATPTDRNYVVVDDALPAGLEALNAAFATTDASVLGAAGTGQGGWWGSFNHTELRDDRVLLFADYLHRGEHTYTYVARATTPGTFVHPPAQAEMMYRPSVSGRTATGRLVVR